MTSVSIIGLGWLGEPLAYRLLESGFSVKGSTTSQDKSAILNGKGISTSVLKFNPYPEGYAFLDLFDTDILFVNIPPRTRTMPDSFHLEQLKFIKEMAIQSGVEKIIYISSTSIYPDIKGVVDESFTLDINNTGNKALFQAEQILSKEKAYHLTIIRFGGLLGVNRIPGKYFSGKSNVTGDSPVNYIHRDDAVNMAFWVIANNLWEEVYNGVAPKHPERKLVYEKNAAELGFPPPESYADVKKSDWKEISSDKISKTGFKFQIPDPLDFWYE